MGAVTEAARRPTTMAVRALDGGHRVHDFVRGHPVLSVFVVALATRLIVATAMDIVLDRSLLLDDAGYTKLAADSASGADAGWEPSKHIQYARNGVFLVPMTILFQMFGPVPLVGQWFVAFVGAAVAALTTRLAMELIERPWAIGAGLVVALLPSQVFFTSLTMKDAFVWTALAIVGVGLAIATRQRGHRLALWLVPCAIALLALTRLRAHTGIVAAWALAIAAWFGLRSQRRVRLSAALVLAVALPWIGGLGPAGVTFLKDLTSVSGYRQAQATGNTPLITPTTRPGSPSTTLSAGASGSPGRRPKPSGRGGSGSGELPTSAAPAAIAEPESSVADEGWYPGGTATASSSADRDIRHLPRGLAVMLLEPHPFRRAPNTQVWLAKAEMALWYPLLAFAAIGLVALLRVAREAGRAAAFPVLAGAGSLFVAALAEGNFGTAFRHRGEFVWVVALLAAVGLRHLWLRRRGIDAPAGVANVVGRG